MPHAGAHKYTRDGSPLFVAEAYWKYNHRQDAERFNGFPRRVFSEEMGIEASEVAPYKPSGR